MTPETRYAIRKDFLSFVSKAYSYMHNDRKIGQSEIR